VLEVNRNYFALGHARLQTCSSRKTVSATRTPNPSENPSLVLANNTPLE